VLLSVCIVLAQCSESRFFPGVDFTECDGSDCETLTENVACGHSCHLPECTKNCVCGSTPCFQPKCTVNCSATADGACFDVCEENCIGWTSAYYPVCKTNCQQQGQADQSSTSSCNDWWKSNLWWVITVPVVLVLLCCFIIAGCMGLFTCCGLFKKQHQRRQEQKAAREYDAECAPGSTPSTTPVDKSSV